MVTRRGDLGSWLEGTPGEPVPGEASGLGLPASGAGSMAPVGRRVVAVTVDWVLSLAVSAGFFPQADAPGGWLLAGDPTATLAVFALSTVVLVATSGATVGHRLVGLRVVRLVDVFGRGAEALDGSRPGPPGATASVVAPDGPVPAVGTVPALARTVLLSLVLPAVVWDRHGRGLHDVAAGTVVVRR